MYKNKNKYRIIASMVLFFFSFQLVEIPIANGFTFFGIDFSESSKSAKEKYGIVAILVEEELMEATTKYDVQDSTYDEYLNNSTLADRIRRYAVDAQNTKEYTKSLILKVAKDSKTEEIAHALEKLFQEGDLTKNENNELAGVVLIGDVPLPVVNKKGNRFVSMLPYTDFEDKVYIFDAEQNEFLSNPNLKFAKADVWHGVIRPPVSGSEGLELLAHYFDKNHLFHLGVEEYSEFDQKLLFADLPNEFKAMDKFQFKSYLRYLAYAGDQAYLRYNKHWAEKLFNEVNGNLKKEGIEMKPPGPESCDAQCVILKNARNEDFDSDGYSNGYELFVGSKSFTGSNDPTDPRDPDSIPTDYTDPGVFGFSNRIDPNPLTYVSKDDGSKLDYPDPPLQEGLSDSFKELPDIQSKQIIQNFLAKYVQLFDKFLGTMNDWINFTGRYNAEKDLHSLPYLISTKDLFTSVYLRDLNDAMEKKIDEYAEKLQMPIKILESSEIGGNIVLDDNSWSLEDVTFINFSTHSSSLFGLGVMGTDTLYMHGTPIYLSPLGVQACSLYRGSNDGTKENSVMVKAIRTLNGLTGGDPDDNEKFAGCYGNNVAHPERCFPLRAELSIFDINGTEEVKPGTVSDSASNHRSCFDFKEEDYYDDYEDEVDDYLDILEDIENEEGKKLIGAPKSPYKPSTQIILYDDNGIKITLADVLDKFGLGDGKDNDSDGSVDEADEKDPKFGIPANDWQQIGERLLKKETTLVFINPFSGVKSLILKIDPEEALSPINDSPVLLPSISYHKEPTNKTINAQLSAGGFAKSLPIDNPRFVSFNDITNTFRKIIYPDSFEVKSFEEYLDLLKQKEADIKNLADVTGLNVDKNFLTNIVNGKTEVYDNESKLLKTNAEKLDDAFAWQSMNIDDKHQYVLQKYLSRDAEPFIEKQKNGYEALYLVGEGRADSFEMRFNGDFPEDDVDIEFNDTQTQIESEENDFGSSNNEDDGIDLFSWFGEISKWVEQTTSKVGEMTSGELSCNVPENESTAIDSSSSFYAQTKIDIDSKEEKNNTVKLSISADKDVLKTGSGDSLKIRIEGLSFQNELQTDDSQTIVDLVLVNPKDREVARLVTEARSLVKGEAVFTVQATNESGEFSVYAETQSGLKSNTLKVNSTRRKIKIVSYEKNYELAYDKKPGSGFVIKDENENIIAEVNGETGMITIVDDAFKLVVFQADKDKPTRLSVQQKNTLEVVGDVFFIADKVKPVLIDSSSMDYFKSYITLEGTHVKDLNNLDNFSVKTAVGGADFYLGSAKIGFIENVGNIYLDKDYVLQLKDESQKDSPVVFVILDKSGAKLFEVYIGVKFEKLEILKEFNIDLLGWYPEMFLEKLRSRSRGHAPRDLREGVHVSPSELAQPSLKTFLDTSLTNILIPSANAANAFDQDNDGLNDLEEIVLGTDPSKKDTDGDSFGDGLEIENGFDPKNKDKSLFKDLNTKSEGFKEIINLVKRGVISGSVEGNFRPTQTLTREEFVKLDLGSICINCTNFNDKIKKAIDSVYQQNPFPDQNIDPNLLYCVEEGKNRGIISGYKAFENAGQFVPKAFMSIVEASKVVLETARQQSSKLQFTNYALNGKPWFYNYVLTAQKEKFYPKGRFLELDTFDSESFKKWFESEILNPNSKFIQWLGGGITRSEFAIMVSKLTEKYDCLLIDQDKDGVSDNLEKYIFGTDINSKDTDQGGVDDLTEISRKSDPLNKEDDFPKQKDQPKILDFKYESTSFNGKEGAYVVGENISENYIYEEIKDNAARPLTLEYTDEIPADNESKLFLKAEILDENGDIDETANGKTIKLYSNNSQQNAVIEKANLVTSNGVAETEIKSTLKAGEYIVAAEVDNEKLPFDNKSIFVVPLEAYSISLDADSKVIKSGGLSSTTTHASLKDKNGNLLNEAIHQLTFEVEGPGNLNLEKDEDPNLEGLQISSVSGIFDIQIISTEQDGDIKVKASFQETSDELVSTNAVLVKSEITIRSAKNLYISLSASTTNIISNGEAVTTIEAVIRDENNQIISNFNGEAQFVLYQNSLAEFATSSNQPLKNGRATVALKSTYAAGDITVSATVPGFDPTNIIINSLPQKAAKILLEAEADTVESGSSLHPGSPVQITAKLFDENNNFVQNDSSTIISFRLTEDTKQFAFFDSLTEVQAQNGEAQIALRATDLTGPIRIFASVDSLRSGTLELQSVKKFYGEDFQNISTNTLFASILGSEFGNVLKEDYLAGHFVFSGKAQSAISLLSQPKPKMRIAQIGVNGSVSLLNEENVQAKFIPGNSITKNNKIVLSDPVTTENLAEVYIVPSSQNKVVIGSPTTESNETTYVENLVNTEEYDFKEVKETVLGAIAILKNDNEAIKIYDNGSIKIYDNDLTVLVDQGNEFLSLKITDKGLDIAKITFVNNILQNVKELKSDETLTANDQGIFVKLLSSKFGLEESFSGNSTSNARGLYLTDPRKEIEKDQAPGLSYLSLESAPDEQGVGFSGDNKHMLLFAAGNSVGESYLPYSSEIGVVLGDPTIRLKDKSEISGTGFSKDIGEEIYFGSQEIQEINVMDYNSDELQDLLVAYENGEVRLLQNNLSSTKFEDRGIFLRFSNGILSMTVADFNKDEKQDLVVASKESCRKDEVCIDIYENQGSGFVRKNLNLQPFSENNRVYMIRAGDVNNDGYADLITSDDSGTIRVFYNKKGEIEKQGKFVGSLGIHIDNTANLKTEVLVAYDGMPQNNPNLPEDDIFFKDLPLTAADKQIPKPFIYLDSDPLLLTSEKRAEDQSPPLDSVAIGDLIKYTITVKNSSNSDLKNFMVSDNFPSNMEIDKNSIVCTDCKEQINLGETGLSLRPYIISGLNLPKKQSRSFSYIAKIKTTPKIKIIVGNNLSKDYSPQDKLMDIAAIPEGNSTGRTTYYYSLSKNSKGEVAYSTFVSAPPDPAESVPPPVSPLGVPPTEESFEITDDDGIPIIIQNYLKKQNTADSDGDGLTDSWDDVKNVTGDINAGINKAGEAIQTLVDGLGCNGGCIPMPINYAFLAAGAINAMGIPVGFDPGLPVLGFGVPSLIPVWPAGGPYQGALATRIYISPTLTMALGVGICLGPYLAGQCFAFAVPPAVLGMAALCESIAGSINSAISSANSAIQSVNNTTAFNSGGTPVDADTGGRTETGGMAGSKTLGNYEYKASANTNFQVPGFPSFISKWLSDQKAEIINKLVDLSDFYFIYPDPTSIVGTVLPTDQGQTGGADQKKAFDFPNISGKPFEDENGNVTVSTTFNPSNILNAINSIPLVQIESKEIPFKIPALSQKEISKFQSDMQQWVEDEKKEIERVKALWGCDDNSEYQNICDKLLLDAGELEKSVEKNIEILEKYKELPRKILSWKNATSKYLYQVICYLDAVTQFTGGYVKKQESRINTWLKAIRQAKQLIETWKALFDLVIDYQAACDKCTSARFTLMELILKLFAVIPSPPVIPMPKWPDIYMDFSNIHTGLTVLWPDVKFIPERIILPKLPRITLPDLPTLSISLPAIPILPDVPELPELPDLPPLPLPSLPDIPPPPKIPDFPVQIKAVVDILKNVFKIICLIKKGLVPISELALKSHIEQLTERPLNPLLPIDLGIKLQIPPISYEFVERIELKGELNFELNFDSIYNFVNNVATDWNAIATDLIKKLNEKLKEGSDVAEAGASTLENAGNSVVPEDVSVDLDTHANRLRAENLSITDIDSAQATLKEKIAELSQSEVKAMLEDLKNADPIIGPLLNKLFDAYKEAEKVAKENVDNQEAIYLTATEIFLDTDHKLLNRSLDEVKAGISLQTNSQDRVSNLRDTLIAYAENREVINSLEISDLNAAGRVLAQAKTLNEHAQAKRVRLTEYYEEKESLLVKNNTRNDLPKLEKEIVLPTFEATEKRLIADVSPAPETPGTPGAQIVPKGIYIYNTEKNINDRLIDYTEEADATSHLAFLDMDNDSDEDIIYSYNGNIYLKENYKSASAKKFYKNKPVVKDLTEFIPSAPAVNSFTTTSDNNNSVELSWDKAIYGASGYLITYYPDINQKGDAKKVAAVSLQKMIIENVKGNVYIENENGKERVKNGSIIEVDSVLSSQNGSARIKFEDSSFVEIEDGESLTLKEVDDLEEPAVSLQIPNGFYYARIQSFNKQGELSTKSSVTLLSPNVCSDRQVPFPNAGQSERTVSIFKALTIDASKSFDSEGKIISYYLDDDLKTDSDFNGDSTDDKNVGNDININVDSDFDSIKNNELNNPIFTIGPFEDLKDREVMLNVIDESLNKSQQKIVIHVTVPEIAVDESTATSGVISGNIQPTDSGIPIAIVRDRGGLTEIINTESANSNSKYLTDKNGLFKVSDLNLEDQIIVKNGKGEIVAEIISETGRIIITDKRYKVEVLPAELPLKPTRIVIKEIATNEIILTLFLVADLNTDTVIDPPDLEYTKVAVGVFKGVHVKDLNKFDSLEFEKIPSDDLNFPGATQIIDSNSKKRLAILDTGGNFYKLDESLGLRLKQEDNKDDPLVIEILENKEVIGEFYVSVNSKDGIQVVPEDKFKVFTEEKTVKGPLYDSDHDLIPDQFELIYQLNPNDKNDAAKDLDNDGLTNLEEYSAGTNPLDPDSDKDGYLDGQELINGKDPNKKAVLPFKDINKNHPHYQSILNLFERNVLDGILKGDTEFNPNGAITRAEFADIMLKIFCIIPRKEAYEGPSAFNDLEYNSTNLPPYYAVIQEAYFQGFITGYKAEIDSKTGKTPFKPYAVITKAEAIKIILEAMDKKGVIEMGEVPLVDPYYQPYLQIAQDLTPYLKLGDRVKKTFIVTSDEIKMPEKAISRGEFITMADRVLTAYDCSVIDDDFDGMPSFWEKKHSLNPLNPEDANFDNDNDELINLSEYKRGTDPRNPDTDAGSVKDGVEVKKNRDPLNGKDDPIDSDDDGLPDRDEINVYKTNPLDADTDDGGVDDGTEVLIYNSNPLFAEDDKDSDSDSLSNFDEENLYKTNPLDADTDDGGVDDGTEVGRGTEPLNPLDDLIDPRSDLEEGIYVIQEKCLACPCKSSIDHTADLIVGDKVFGIISNKNNSEIFRKSNVVEIKEIPVKPEIPNAEVILE